MGIFNAFCNYGKKKSKFGITPHGMRIYIKNSLDKFIKSIYDEYKMCVWVRFDRNMFESDKDVLVCAVYIPPSGSGFYSEYEQNGVMMFEEELSNILY